jgi:hypothetical protein
MTVDIGTETCSLKNTVVLDWRINIHLNIILKTQPDERYKFKSLTLTVDAQSVFYIRVLIFNTVYTRESIISQKP